MATVIIAVIVFAVIGLAVFFTIRNRSKGGCNCGCDSCGEHKTNDCDKKDKNGA